MNSDKTPEQLQIEVLQKQIDLLEKRMDLLDLRFKQNIIDQQLKHINSPVVTPIIHDDIYPKPPYEITCDYKGNKL